MRKMIVMTLAALLVALVVGGALGGRAEASGSYYGAWYGTYNHVRFCGTQLVDFSNAARWATPHGCYGRVMSPTFSAYPWKPSVGWCNWIPEEAHAQYGSYSVLHLAKHWGAPRMGAVVWFNPGDQGAGGDGHFAQLIAIGPNGWGLIEEMNFTWRGAGFGRVDYRFIRLYQAGTAYLYP